MVAGRFSRIPDRGVPLPLEHELGTLDVLKNSDLAHANAPWFVVPHPTVAPIWNSKSFLP